VEGSNALDEVEMIHNKIWAYRVLHIMGERDARLGKTIDAFYQIPRIRHGEGERAEYEMGYRAEKRRLRRKAHEYSSQGRDGEGKASGTILP
jgi:hypothetical protein